MYYSMGIIFYGVLDLLNKAFYAKKNSIVPATVAILAIGLNFIFSYILKKYMGLFGLSLSTTLVYMFMAITLFAILNKKVRFFHKKDFIFILKLILYGILCYLVSNLVFGLIPYSENLILKLLRTGISASGGLIVYGLIVFIFHRKELIHGKD